MSFENRGDDKRCDHCNRPGKPYTYRGRTFSGLCPTEEGKLCPSCRDAYLERKTPRLEDIPVQAIAAEYRAEYADCVRPSRRRKRAA